MYLFENRPFQLDQQLKYPSLTESSVQNACCYWLSNGRSINDKNLDYEIETCAGCLLWSSPVVDQR